MFAYDSQPSDLGNVASSFSAPVLYKARSECVQYIDDGYYPTLGEEAAGGVGKILGVVAAIAMPFAAPAIFTAVASSGILGAGIAAAAGSAGFLGSITGIVGSAITGGILNAGIAYASGARGGDVWRAAGMGALSGGMGSIARGASAVAAQTGSTAATTAVPSVASGMPLPGSGAGGVLSAGGSVVAPVTTAATTSPSIVSGITHLFGNIPQEAINRIGATLINAAVNNQDMGRLNGLVAQQRAELDALAQSNHAVYLQRIAQAQQLIQSADQSDPAWRARIAMADVAGMEATQFDQTMRNIATRQGGSLDSGQKNAYERGAKLHAARSKALAYNQEFQTAKSTQDNARAQAAGLLGPDTAGMEAWSNKTELLAAQERARREANASTFGGLVAGLTEQDHPASVSPDPSVTHHTDGNDPFHTPLGGG